MNILGCHYVHKALYSKEKQATRIDEILCCRLNCQNGSRIERSSSQAIRFFYNLRVKIALKQQRRHDQLYGSVELEESYFGGVRKGTVVKIGEAEVPKAVAVFGILKRGGKVYTQIIADATTKTLMPIILIQ